MDIIREILNFWSQILLLLTGIGVLIKMIFNFILKKKEIKYGIFYKSKMDALVRFYNAYAEVKSMWRKLPVNSIYSYKLSADEIDKMIQPPLNKLEASVIELESCFNPDLYKKFKQVEKNIYQLNSTFLDNTFNNNSEQSLVAKCNNYTSSREEIEKLNRALLTDISKEIYKNHK